MGETDTCLQAPGKQSWKMQGEHVFLMELDLREGRRDQEHKGTNSHQEGGETLQRQEQGKRGRDGAPF